MYWTKRIGPRHLMGRHETLCGKPMLGNNHTFARADAPICEECEAAQEASKKEKKQTRLELRLVEEDPEQDVIRAKGLMDGANSLTEAAQMLANEAQRLRDLVRDGFKLTAKVEDDYGFIAHWRKSCSE